MDRRDFLKSAGAAGAFSLLSRGAVAAAEEAAPGPESRRAFQELLELLRVADREWLGPDWGILRDEDVADGERFLLHLLATGLHLKLEADPERPLFQRIVTPTRKILGDNPDAVYFEAAIRGDRSYRIRGNTAGAVYTSFTIETGAIEGGYSAGVGGALNDTQFDVDGKGNYEIRLAPATPKAPERGVLHLPKDARTVTTRHYFEEEHSVAADPGKRVPISIEPVEAPGPAAAPDDASIAASIRRVIAYVQGNTIHQLPPSQRQLPDWVSTTPNRFNAPAKPGEMGFAAVDNAYTMAPYVLREDQSLVIEGRWPGCRFANVVLWNRFLQSYDYVHRRVSLNRRQTKVGEDGRFRIVVAHRDPGVPNWLDTAGRSSGSIYWRFLLPEGKVATPEARVVRANEVV